MFRLIRLLTPWLGAERAHEIGLWLLRAIDFIPGAKWLIYKIYGVKHPSLGRYIFGLHFRNPIGLAAGFDRNGKIYNAIGSFGFGFVEIGTVTPRPQQGNPKPRLFHLPIDGAIVNRTGLMSDGLEKVMVNIRKEHPGLVLGCNIGKNTITPEADVPADYLRVFRNLYQYADYFTVNISYNTTHKQYVPRSRESIMEIIGPLFEFRRGQNQYRPILLKISPDISNEEIDLMTDIMIDTPLDGIVATNATTSKVEFLTPTEEVKQVGRGAVSGSPLTRRAIEVVERIHRRCNGTYPIIGVGGIMSSEDAQAMLRAGASLIQVHTGLIYNGAGFVGDLCRSLISETEEASAGNSDKS